MKISMQYTAGLAVLFAAAGSVQGVVPNLVANGDFESGNTGFITAYTYAPNDVWFEGTYDVVSNPQIAHYGATSFQDHTTGSGLMLVVNNSGTAGDTIWEQTVSVQAGTQYQLSLWHANWDGLPTPVFGVEIDSYIGLDVNVTQPAGTWNEYNLLWTSGASTTATIRIINRTGDVLGNDLAVDDISLTPIPEPSIGITAMLAMIGLGVRYRASRKG